jgi:hypothetical protein
MLHWSLCSGLAEPPALARCRAGVLHAPNEATAWQVLPGVSQRGANDIRFSLHRRTSISTQADPKPSCATHDPRGGRSLRFRFRQPTNRAARTGRNHRGAPTCDTSAAVFPKRWGGANRRRRVSGTVGRERTWSEPDAPRVVGTTRMCPHVVPASVDRSIDGIRLRLTLVCVSVRTNAPDAPLARCVAEQAIPVPRSGSDGPRLAARPESVAVQSLGSGSERRYGNQTQRRAP